MPQPAAFRLPLRHRQALPPPEPLDPLVVDGEPLGTQQRRDAAVAVPAVLAGQLDHPRHQPGLVVGDGRRALLGRAALAQDLARPALGDAVGTEHLKGPRRSRWRRSSRGTTDESVDGMLMGKIG
jgi:hypothetical protein